MGIECGCSMPSMTSASATWSGSSVLSCRFSCSRLSRMSSRRRSPPRRSDSPGRSIGESLPSDGGDECAGHLVGPLELEPVSRALQNLELVLTCHMLRGLLSLQTSERRVLVAPCQHSRCADLDLSGP